MSKAKGLLNEMGALIKHVHEKEQMRSMLPKGFVSFSGVKWADQQVKAYNDYQKKINQYIKDGKDVPEELLNASHKLFVMFSDATLKK